MRKLIWLLTVTALLLTGCGDITWFPDNSTTNQNDLSFAAQTGVKVITVVDSAPAVISGITGSVNISVTNGEYSVNGGAFISTSSTVSNGQAVVVRHTSAAAVGTTVTTTLTVGTKTATFSSTTGTDPAFTFPTKSVTRNTQAISDKVTINGITSALTLSVSGSATGIGYSIDGATTCSSADTTISAGHTLALCHTAGLTALQTATTIVTLSGGASALTGSFTSIAQ